MLELLHVDSLTQLRFHGLVSATRLLNAVDLADAIGLTMGNALNADTNYFHFEMFDRHLYFPTKPIRNMITWAELNNLGAVNGQKTIFKDNTELSVRLIDGGKSATEMANSEWNQLIYRVSDQHNLIPQWLSLDRYALVMDGDQLGQATITKEATIVNDIVTVVFRGTGGQGPNRIYTGTDEPTIYRGWRPILEHISGPVIF